jgi:hypothetical protein
MQRLTITASAPRRRAEEAEAAARVADRYQWARRHGAGVSLAVARAYHLLQLQRHRTAPADELSLIPMWQQHIKDLCAAHRIEYREVNATALNGYYSWAFARVVELVGGVFDSESYACGLHEIAHVDLGHTPSVAVEIPAWIRAAGWARPTWSRRMHARLTRGLLTYRAYATRAEAAQIDALTSNLGFRRLQVWNLKARTYVGI